MILDENAIKTIKECIDCKDFNKSYNEEPCNTCKIWNRQNNKDKKNLNKSEE
jgi:hypothetical protein